MPVREHALYRLLETPAPDAAKGSCYLTGSSGPCVDTGVLVDFEGTLTISLAALVELCEVAGFSFSREGRKLEEDNARLYQLTAELLDEKEDLLLQLNAVALAVAHAAAPEPRGKK